MSVSKRPSTSSLRRFITTRSYVTVAELRRRFCLDEPDAVCCVRRNGTSAFVGLPEREATKLQDLWEREEIGLELSVEVRAPVVVGIYPMHIARFIQEHSLSGTPAPNGHTQASINDDAQVSTTGHAGTIPSGQATMPGHPDAQVHGHAAAGLNAFVNHGPGSPDWP